MPKNDNQVTDMVLVMGVTGAGKSYFINKLKEGAVEEGEGLQSRMLLVFNLQAIDPAIMYKLTSVEETAICQVVSVQVGSTGFAIVDCPGFNDTYRSNTEILEEISKVFCAQSILSRNLRLKGILYLHGIDNSRMEGSHLEALNTLQEIVGDAAFSNIVLVTTKWGKIPSNIAIKKETELRDIYWKRMIEKGYSMARFHGDGPSAQGIVSQLITKPQVSTALQHELLQENKTLLETSAGRFLLLKVEARYECLKKDLLELSKRIREEKNGTRRIVLQIDKDRVEAESARTLLDKKTLGTRVGVETKIAVEIVQAGGNAGTNKSSQPHDSRLQYLQTFCSVLGFGFTVILPAIGVSCLIM